MTETIKQILFNYIFCAVIGGVLEYLVPQKMAKTLRICVISVMLLTSVSPLLNMHIDFSQLTETTEAEESNLYNALYHTASVTEKMLYKEMKNILINLNIDEYEIYVDTTVDAEKSIVYLDEIKIEVDNTFANKIPQIKKNIPEEYKEILKVGVKNE